MKHRDEELIEIARRVLTENYRQAPVVLERGRGCEVWDTEGKRYLDLTAGIAACPLGHAHPRLVAALAEQAGRLIHVSNLFYNVPQIQLAEQLTVRARALAQPRVFFCNSGAEANEAAIKLAKRYQQTICGRSDRVEVISFEGSFHGRTIATVALTGQEKYRSGFGPLIEWAKILPWPTDGQPSSDAGAASTTIDAITNAITNTTCAVIVEPIQAEGGIRAAPPGFLAALRKRCSETGTILIFDEVQTGVGRTGPFFGFEHDGAAPDILSLAKGLGGGVPIGCIVAAGEVAKGFAPGSHASTFGGNPLAAAGALAVLETLEADQLLNRVEQAGQLLAKGLSALVRRFAPRAKEVRGRGLLRGLTVDGDATPLVTKARERGVLLSVAGGTTVRFAPPYVVTDAQLDEGVAALEFALGMA